MKKISFILSVSLLSFGINGAANSDGTLSNSEFKEAYKGLSNAFASKPADSSLALVESFKDETFTTIVNHERGYIARNAERCFMEFIGPLSMQRISCEKRFSSSSKSMFWCGVQISVEQPDDQFKANAKKLIAAIQFD